MSYEIVELDITDLDKIFDLTVASGLNAGHSRETWLNTQHWLLMGSKELTGMDAPSGHVVLKGNEVVGYVGYTHRLFKCDGKIFPAVVAIDLVIHPDHRGLAGIMLGKRTYHHFGSAPSSPKVIGLHNNQGAMALYKALGAQEVPDTGQTFTAIVSVGNLLSYRMPILGPLLRMSDIPDLFPFVPGLLARSGKPVIRKGPLSMQACSPGDIFGNENFGLQELLQSFDKSFDTGVVRDLGYLKWRYIDHPTRSFQWYGLFSNNRISALAVAQRLDDGSTNLCELVVGPEDINGSMQDVLRAALFVCGKNGSGIVRSKFLTSQLLAAFREIGAGEHEKEYNQFSIFPPTQHLGNTIFTFGDNKIL
jgi:hypothetical protein